MLDNISFIKRQFGKPPPDDQDPIESLLSKAFGHDPVETPAGPRQPRLSSSLTTSVTSSSSAITTITTSTTSRTRLSSNSISTSSVRPVQRPSTSSRISSTTSAATRQSSSSASAIPQSDNSQSSNSKSGPNVGAIVGGIAGALLVIVIFVLVRRWYARKDERRQQEEIAAAGRALSPIEDGWLGGRPDDRYGRAMSQVSSTPGSAPDIYSDISHSPTAHLVPAMPTFAVANQRSSMPMIFSHQQPGLPYDQPSPISPPANIAHQLPYPGQTSPANARSPMSFPTTPQASDGRASMADRPAHFTPPRDSVFLDKARYVPLPTSRPQSLQAGRQSQVVSVQDIDFVKTMLR